MLPLLLYALQSNLKDTNAFLRIIKGINRERTISPNTILLKMDLTGLYTDNLRDEGIMAMEEELEK